MFEGTAEWIVSCQTYEGGFGATPFNEAHGGYSFCALAALKLLGKEKLCNLDSLTVRNWPQIGLTSLMCV